jgi:crossover junction endodeoxyribonuclease RuvC
MPYSPRILALDLASRTGWACGNCSDAVPRSGSVRFARDGASMGALFAGCRQWLSDFLAAEPDIKLIVFEAPMDPMMFAGARRPETARQLIGLCAIVEECTYGCGYDVREARVSDVRVHFLGTNRIKRKEAKAATIEACHRLGWAPTDDNAADALALWHYQASILDPQLAMQTSPLFRRRAASVGA